LATPRPRRAAAPLLLALSVLSGPAAQASPDLERCLEGRGFVRLARVVGSDGAPAWARVLAHEDGVPTEVVPVAAGASDLADAFARAADPPTAAPAWRIAPSERTRRICAPLRLGQGAIDAETQVVVAAGLNYAAHAEEAGGGDGFIFPKPVAPGAPYGAVAAPAGVKLLDYEVELAFVLLTDVDLRALPSRKELMARSAFFVANDLTDREPIIVHKALSGPGTGFVEAKGQPGFLPAGPWLVRGSELFAALDACGEPGLGLRLEVDEGDGFRTRQEATTAAMILDPHALLARIADEVLHRGARTPMPVRRAGGVRHYPLAVASEDGALRLPAGSVVLTGTPEGIALQVPSPLGLIARGLRHARGPFEQLRQEELARAAAGGPGGYLAPGERVRARIDGLGAQIVRVAEPGSPLAHEPCAGGSRGTEVPTP
jgi:2-keto-4-pentenoate hydratase/2-oxohepta-3-ene-1,7-dioic acid hydratase in catechol pathway